jgi:hypothetical protein
MFYRNSISIMAMATGFILFSCHGVPAAEGMKYPDWQGAWARWAPPNAAREAGNGGLNLTAGGQPSFDQTKPWGLGQQAPLTPEYQKVFKDSIADQARGGQGNFSEHARCMPGGMPLNMIAFFPLEFVVAPDTTYVLIGGNEHFRRIFTDGRDWPSDIEASFAGYSIGKWIDEDGDGVYDVLEVETRGPFKGRRAYNESSFEERIYRDRTDSNLLHDEITVLDHALTRPWTVDKRYVLDQNPRPRWTESYCTENPTMVAIGGESYWLSGDGRLMPIRKDQPPPDLRYFKQGSER